MDSTLAIAQEIVLLLRERPDRAEREDRLCEEIALGDQWSQAECSEGIKYMRTVGWVCGSRGRICLTQDGLHVSLTIRRG
jgi:hypothetical protein